MEATTAHIAPAIINIATEKALIEDATAHIAVALLTHTLSSLLRSPMKNGEAILLLLLSVCPLDLRIEQYQKFLTLFSVKFS